VREVVDFIVYGGSPIIFELGGVQTYQVHTKEIYLKISLKTYHIRINSTENIYDRLRNTLYRLMVVNLLLVVREGRRRRFEIASRREASP